MKNDFFVKISLQCLLCLLIVIVSSGFNKASANKVTPAEKDFPEKLDKFQDPIEYVLGKLEDYDLVMIGERHWVREEPTFIQNLIKRCYEKNAIDVVFLEFGKFKEQGKIDSFMDSAEYDPKPVIDVLRNSYELGWGYQEYFDIFKLIYDENRKRNPSERIKLVLVDPSFDDVDLWSHFYQCLKLSPMPEEQKAPMAGALYDATTDRDSCMADVIEAYRYNTNLVKGIYYAGGSHVRKDLQKKDYGRRYFSAGGILACTYPGRVCCLTFHEKPEFWQSISDFDCIEELFKGHKRPFAVDTNNPKISHLKLRSDVIQEGIALNEAYDGYIMLNLNSDYQPCAFVPGFYDDEFAKVVWDRLRKRKVLERFPPEFERYKTETPTGEELMKMIRQGLH
ncbi:MAG: hypothetical protein ACETWQ_15325 [Phycisphaerae bacterium]